MAASCTFSHSPHPSSSAFTREEVADGGWMTGIVSSAFGRLESLMAVT